MNRLNTERLLKGEYMDDVKVNITEQRLREIQERIDSGAYIIDASQLADTLIDDVLCEIDPTMVETIFE